MIQLFGIGETENLGNTLSLALRDTLPAIPSGNEISGLPVDLELLEGIIHKTAVAVLAGLNGLGL
jgi:hypothetical protein